MGKTLLTIRLFFFLTCVMGSFLVAYAIPEWDDYRGVAMFVGVCIGTLTILVDIFLKGFSLRGMSALTFGLAVGGVVAWMIDASPLFEAADEEYRYLTRMTLFVVMMYLGAVVALRGKDEFNLVIPYVRFVPHGVEIPLVVVDTSALIDGRVAEVCEHKLMGYALVIPRFVLDELQLIADSDDPDRRERGRRGLEVLNRLHRMEHLDLRIHESDVADRRKVDSKLIFLAQSMRAKLLTTDYNLARLAEFHGIDWINLNALARALNPEIGIGQTLELDLVKPGREPDQAVAFLRDGSMVVVKNARDFIGQNIPVEIESVIPSGGGKLVFGRPAEASATLTDAPLPGMAHRD